MPLTELHCKNARCPQDRQRLRLADSAGMYLDAALRGRGIALLPRLMASDALAASALVQLQGYPASAKETLWISRTQGEPRSPLVKGVFDTLLRMSQNS